MQKTLEQLSFAQRANFAKNPLAKELFTLMEEKKSNLCCNPDFTKAKDLIALTNLIGPEICVLKTHIDILEDFTPEVTRELARLAEKHRFMIFEDRKFCDIGSIVKKQYGGGVYKIADWAHITNAQIVSGPGVIEGLKQIGLPQNRALLLIAQMSSEGTLAHGEYTKTAVKFAEKHSDFVIGFICREKLSNNPGILHFTPGVKKTEGTDGLGQQFLTPEKVIKEQGSDIIIVGRGIYQSSSPLEEAKLYRKLAWEAYQNSL